MYVTSLTYTYVHAEDSRQFGRADVRYIFLLPIVGKFRNSTKRRLPASTAIAVCIVMIP